MVINIIIFSYDICLHNILPLWVRKIFLVLLVMAYLVNTNGNVSLNLDIVAKIDYILFAVIILRRLRLLFCITSYSPYFILSCERIPALESTYWGSYGLSNFQGDRLQSALGISGCFPCGMSQSSYLLWVMRLMITHIRWWSKFRPGWASNMGLHTCRQRRYQIALLGTTQR